MDFSESDSSGQVDTTTAVEDSLSSVESDDSGQLSDDSQAQTQEEQVQEILSWEQDKRFEKMWKGDPNNLYKSYKEMEKLHSPLKKQIQDYTSKIANYDKEIGTYKQQVEQLSEVQNIIQFFESSPQYQKAIIQALEGVQKEELTLKYGNLPPEAIEKLEKAERVERQLNQWQQQEQIKQHQSKIESTFSDLDSLAEKYGLDWSSKNPDQRNDFLRYCIDMQVTDPRLMKSLFESKALPLLLQNSRMDAEMKTIKKVKAQTSGALPPMTNRMPSVKPADSFKDKLRAAFRK